MRLITDYLDNIAEKESEKVALADVDKTVTYGDLCDVAKRIASSIIATGTFRQPIAVIMDEGVDMIAAFLGVAESGNFYASIDATLPTKMKEERLSYLKPTIIITTDPAMTDICKKSCPEAETVFFSKLISANREENGIENVRKRLIDSDPLYLIFTSGSTGSPKGVVVTHRNAVYLAKANCNLFNIQSNAVMANQFSMHFVAGTILIYSVILKGGTCLLGMNKLVLNYVAWSGMMHDYHVNYINGTPSAFSLMGKIMSEDDRFEDVKHILIAGASLTVRELRHWYKYFPNASIYSGYGMSELGGYSISVDISEWMARKKRKENQLIPLGRPVENMDAFVVDENGKETDCGIKGELYIRFSALPDGYYGELEKTNELLVQNPLEKRFRDICIRTGDLAYWDEEGYLNHAGRIDFMVKRHGIRIELGEIEEKVREAGAYACVCVYFDARIIAYYTGEVSEKEVFDFLHGHMPAQSVPDFIEKIDVIPLNRNGKYDREELKRKASRRFGA